MRTTSAKPTNEPTKTTSEGTSEKYYLTQEELRYILDLSDKTGSFIAEVNRVKGLPESEYRPLVRKAYTMALIVSTAFAIARGRNLIYNIDIEDLITDYYSIKNVDKTIADILRTEIIPEAATDQESYNVESYLDITGIDISGISGVMCHIVVSQMGTPLKHYREKVKHKDKELSNLTELERSTIPIALQYHSLMNNYESNRHKISMLTFRNIGIDIETRNIRDKYIQEICNRMREFTDTVGNRMDNREKIESAFLFGLLCDIDDRTMRQLGYRHATRLNLKHNKEKFAEQLLNS